MRNRFELEIRGYVAHETDFATSVRRRPDLQSPEVTAVIDAAMEGADNADGNKSCAILIVGYSDRDDTAGLSDQQRRASELSASRARADSASAWLLDKVNTAAVASGQQMEVEWRGVSAVAVEAIGVGASDLVTQPANEQDRRQNRRIKFIVSGCNLSTVAERDGHDVLLA